MTTVGHIIEAIEEYKPTLVVMDEGGLGYGILDRLNEQRYKVRGVNFGWKAKNPIMWLNKRTELWGAMREWLKTASVPQDKMLKSDLTGVKSKPTSSGVIQLESKKDMKARGLASPDAADALAVTFAYPVASRTYVEKQVRRVSQMGGGGVSSSWMGS
jgi:phage terminase large subunit